MTDLPDTDFTQRFIFDENDARGELVSLERSYAEVLAKHPYPEPVAQLLGELMAAAALLVGTMKFDGLLILQARSEGPVPMLMIECSSEREIRGLARYHADQIAPDATLSDLMANGVLAITVDPTEGQRYQGIVDLDGETLSDCFTNYFVMSQQVGTKFWLNADGKRARGLLLQQLPADRIKDDDDRAESWRHIIALADTLKAEELLAWTTKPSCIACTTKRPYACSTHRACASIAAVRASVRPMPWSAWAWKMRSNWLWNTVAISRSTASSATSATCSMRRMSLNCSLARASTRLPTPATKTFKHR